MIWIHSNGNIELSNYVFIASAYRYQGLNKEDSGEKLGLISDTIISWFVRDKHDRFLAFLAEILLW